MADAILKSIGDIINSRWKITKSLTSDSGQAHTYKVQDLQNETDKTEYVIKLLNKINNKTLARFEREIKASFTLNHPNIIRAIDSCYEDISEPYLVMELCSGGELNKKKIENLPIIKKLKMFELICEAIAYAHEKKVIHRDIKPANIFLSDQNTKNPVVGDFGICFFEEEESDYERLTAIREQVGAKSFRPPEAEFGVVEELNPSFDVYSLGKLLYWFLSNGDIPIREHYKHRIFDLRNKKAEHSIYLAYEIFDKSIRENPTERYKNAIEMFNDVKKLKDFVANDSRYLDCNIPQKCIFCRTGTYDFVNSPEIKEGKFNYLKSREFGLDILDYSGHSLHNQQANFASYNGLLIGCCDNCGNVQIFKINYSMNDDRTFTPNKKWTSLSNINNEKTEKVTNAETISNNVVANNEVSVESQSKIEIIWDKTNNKYHRITGEKKGQVFVTEKIYLGIRNLSEEVISNVTIQIEELNRRGQIIGHNIPLREVNDSPPFKHSFTLNPKAELLFYVGECSGDERTFRIYSALTDIEPFELTYGSSLPIRVEGSNTLPCKRVIPFMWKHEGLVSP